MNSNLPEPNLNEIDWTKHKNSAEKNCLEDMDLIQQIGITFAEIDRNLSHQETINIPLRQQEITAVCNLIAFFLAKIQAAKSPQESKNNLLSDGPSIDPELN